MKMSESETKRLVTLKLHALADKLDWSHLTIEQKRLHYEAWTNDPAIGGELSTVIDPGKVRVYLKDTVMKRYSRSRRVPLANLIHRLGHASSETFKTYEKPESILFCDGRLYTVTVAKEWKIALLTAYERGKATKVLQSNTMYVVESVVGRYVDGAYRDFINDTGDLLGIKVVWIK